MAFLAHQQLALGSSILEEPESLEDHHQEEDLTGMELSHPMVEEILTHLEVGEEDHQEVVEEEVHLEEDPKQEEDQDQ